VLTREANSLPPASRPSTGLARARSSPVTVLTPLVTSPARARHRPAEVPGTGTGLDGAVETEADAEAEGLALAVPPAETGAEAEILVWPGDRLVDAWPDPEPVRTPVLAASATPPVAKTATDAAMTLAVRSLASGDLIICPLREVFAETR